jgi:hypothetical protein
MSDRELAIIIRAALLAIVDGLERKFHIGKYKHIGEKGVE